MKTNLSHRALEQQEKIALDEQWPQPKMAKVFNMLSWHRGEVHMQTCNCSWFSDITEQQANASVRWGIMPVNPRTHFCSSYSSWRVTAHSNTLPHLPRLCWSLHCFLIQKAAVNKYLQVTGQKSARVISQCTDSLNCSNSNTIFPKIWCARRDSCSCRLIFKQQYCHKSYSLLLLPLSSELKHLMLQYCCF